MSWEGYVQALCANGHYNSGNGYDDIPNCKCGAEIVFRNVVDDTNCDSYNWIEFDSLIVTPRKIERCNLGCDHEMSPAVHRIPASQEEINALREKGREIVKAKQEKWIAEERAEAAKRQEEYDKLAQFFDSLSIGDSVGFDEIRHFIEFGTKGIVTDKFNDSERWFSLTIAENGAKVTFEDGNSWSECGNYKLHDRFRWERY